MDPKNLLDDVLHIAKSSADELLERSKAAAHDLASHVGSDPAAQAKDRAEAAAARARAEAKQDDYAADLRRVNDNVTHTLGQVTQQAGDLAQRALAEAQKAAETARKNAADLTDKAKAAAERTGNDSPNK